MLLAFLKAGKPILPKETILKLLPGLLLAMVIGSLIAAGIGAEFKGIQLVGELPSQLPPPSLPSPRGRG